MVRLSSLVGGLAFWVRLGGIIGGGLAQQALLQQWPLPPEEPGAGEPAATPSPAPPSAEWLRAHTKQQKPKPVVVECPEFSYWSTLKHAPFSAGRHNISHQRPSSKCRRVQFREVEGAIEEMRGVVRDPDLFQLFKNCFPNTLDTAVKWRGHAAGRKDEELTFITTGDIDAMWLRDSANQLQSYKSLLVANSSTDSLASLFRGAINLQARYIISAPFCNAFRAPPECKHCRPASSPSTATSSGSDYVKPFPATNFVFECKWELDSLAAFLQLSAEYAAATGDWRFFGRFRWREAVEAVLRTAAELRVGTYSDEDGSVVEAPYKFQRQTSQASETQPNGGDGSPVRAGTGLVRSAFRPSDDATIFQLLVPANMMFSRYLGLCAEIAARLEEEAEEGKSGGVKEKGEGRKKKGTTMKKKIRRKKKKKSLSVHMAEFAESIREGIEKHARVKHAAYGEMYAYEIDGSGSHSLMDDANLPSLLGAAMMGYVKRTDPTYQNTRRFVLSKDNPYYMRGPIINGTGGPHIGPGMAWPMSLIVRIMTTNDDDEIVDSLRQLISSTDGLGLMHESVNTFNSAIFTRPWFSWANGLFGQMLLDLKERKPRLLSRTSFQ